MHDEVEYAGHLCISTRWVLTYKGEDTKTHLVARGIQEEEDTHTDSPTIGKLVVRPWLAVCASRGSDLKSTYIRSAFP